MLCVPALERLAMYRCLALAAATLGLFACIGGTPSAAVERAPSAPDEEAGSAIARAPASSAATSSAKASAASTERSTGACEDALGDHIAFYGDVERPPDLAKQQVFMELCLALPPLFQLCASPRYQADYEPECRPVHAATGEHRRLWSELFDALREAP